MKKLFYIFLFISGIVLGQSSRYRVQNNTKFGWSQKTVPVKAYSDSTWDLILFKQDLPDFGNGYWSLKGNALATNTLFLGSTDNRTLRFRTNNVERAKIDTLGKTTLFGDFLIKKDAGVVADSNKNIYVTNWPTLTTLSAMYGANLIPSGTNYFWLPAGGGINIINGERQLIINSTHKQMIVCQSTYTSGGTQITFPAISNTLLAANAELRRFTIAGSTVFYANGGTTALNRGVLISADTHSTLAGETATITNDVGFTATAPNAAGGLTQTNAWAFNSIGKSNFTLPISIGSSLLVPTALIHLAAPPSGTPAIKFTSHTVPTLNAGEVDYNTTTGFNFQGNMNTSGSSTVSGIRCNGNATITGTLSLTGYTTSAVAAAIVTATATLDFPNTGNNASSDLTVSVSGAATGDAVYFGTGTAAMTGNAGVFFAWVSAANTVTIRFHNSTGGAVDPASAVFKVVVNKN